MKLKRIASLLLSAGLLLTMAVPAFAADTADITALTEQVSDQLITEHSTDTTKGADHKFTYVAIGDSITAGVGLDGLQCGLCGRQTGAGP